MPRGQLTKLDILSRIFRLRNNITNRTVGQYWSDNNREVAIATIDKILDIIQEYNY